MTNTAFPLFISEVDLRRAPARNIEGEFESPSGPSTDDIDRVVRKLGQMAREATLEYALRVGSLIIHSCYGGDTSKWRSKGPKAMSFRRLSRHPGLPMSASALYRCVAIFELCERLDAVSKWQHLTASHLRSVLPLAANQQAHLLSAANREKWSVQRLMSETQRAAALSRAKPGAAPSAGGRRLTPSWIRHARRLHQCAVETADALNTACDGPSPSDVDGALCVLAGVLADLQRTRARLQRCRTSDAKTTTAMEEGDRLAYEGA